jgi:hypothetical protein
MELGFGLGVLVRCTILTGISFKPERRDPPHCPGPARTHGPAGLNPESALRLTRISNAPFVIGSECFLSKILALFADRMILGRSTWPRIANRPSYEERL